jgi:hypothetical protein
MIVGSGVFGYVLGNVSDIVATDTVSARIQEKVHGVNSYMRSRNLPIPLQVRIRKFFRYMLKHKSVFDERGILEELSLSLRYEVTEFLNKDSIERMPILHGLDPACISLIVENLNPVSKSTGVALIWSIRRLLTLSVHYPHLAPTGTHYLPQGVLFREGGALP